MMSYKTLCIVINVLVFCCLDCIEEWFLGYDKSTCPQCMKRFSFGIVDLYFQLKVATEDYEKGWDKDGVKLKEIQYLIQDHEIAMAKQRDEDLRRDELEEEYLEFMSFYMIDCTPREYERRDMMKEAYGPVEDKICNQVDRRKLSKIKNSKKKFSVLFCKS